MAAPSQRDIINDIKTEQALMKQDVGYMKDRLDVVVDTLNHLAYTPIADHQQLEARVKALEDYNTKNRIGVLLTNDIVPTIFKFIAYAVAIAALYATVKYLSSTGIGKKP